MWDDESKIFSPQLSLSTQSSGWMDTIKSSSSSSSSSASSLSSSSNQRNHINSLSNRINRSSPSINLIVNSDDDDYTILPPSPPINRTPYSRIKGKARSRSSSRARFETLESTSEGPTSMIQERQSTNHHNQLNHNNYHSGRDFSSFDCYQIDNNRKMVNRSKTLNGSEHNLYHVGANVIRKNRENIYEILTSKKFMDTQKTIGSCNILNGSNGNNLIKSQSTQLLSTTTMTTNNNNNKQQSTKDNIIDLDSSIIDADNLTNDALIEREWNKLVNGTCGNSLIRPLTPSNGRKLIVNQNSSQQITNNQNENTINSLTTIKPTSNSLSSLPITKPSPPPPSSTIMTTPKVNNNKLNQVNHHHSNHKLNNQLNYVDDNYYCTDRNDNNKINGKELINEENNRAKLINLFNNMNNQFDHHNNGNHHQLTNNYHINHNNNSINYDDKSNIPGTRFKEILKLYENLGKFAEPTVTVASTVAATTPVEGKKKLENQETKKMESIGLINGGGENINGLTTVNGSDDIVNHQQLKSTILQLDSVCQTRLKSLEECQRKIASLRDELRSKEEENINLKAESDSLTGQLDEVKNGLKFEKERRLSEAERYKKVTGKLYARLDELNRELQESHINYDYLEMAYNRLKGEVSGLQEVHSAEINLMRDRLNDLTNKLSISERSLKNAKSYIGKLESRKRRGSSLRSSSRPNSTGSCNVGGNSDSKEGKLSLSETNKSAGSETNMVKDSSSSNPCIPKDFQHKLQELEVKIARIQVILLANEHQSPDEGLPDIESINSFPSSLPDHHHHNHNHHKLPPLHHHSHHHLPSQIIEITSSPSTINNNNTIDDKSTSLPVVVETISPKSQVNSSQPITINENNLVKKLVNC